jgi:hypothetical protein
MIILDRLTSNDFTCHGECSSPGVGCTKTGSLYPPHSDLARFVKLYADSLLRLNFSIHILKFLFVNVRSYTVFISAAFEIKFF